MDVRGEGWGRAGQQQGVDLPPRDTRLVSLRGGRLAHADNGVGVRRACSLVDVWNKSGAAREGLCGCARPAWVGILCVTARQRY